MSREDEIRERLKAATPGPWQVVTATESGYEGVRAFCEERDCSGHWIVRYDDDLGYDITANSSLIANAPADIAYLLDQLRRMLGYEETHIANLDLLRDENQRLRNERDDAANAICVLAECLERDRTEHKQAFDENQRLRDFLQSKECRCPLPSGGHDPWNWTSCAIRDFLKAGDA